MADLNGRPLTIGSFGLVPLVVATGPAQIRRRAVGTAVFGGMIAAISIGIFLCRCSIRVPTPPRAPQGSIGPPAGRAGRASASCVMVTRREGRRHFSRIVVCTRHRRHSTPLAVPKISRAVEVDVRSRQVFCSSEYFQVVRPSKLFKRFFFRVICYKAEVTPRLRGQFECSDSMARAILMICGERGARDTRS
jgi:hypothetical protein